jgi:hypothetical protein
VRERFFNVADAESITAADQPLQISGERPNNLRDQEEECERHIEQEGHAVRRDVS